MADTRRLGRVDASIPGLDAILNGGDRAIAPRIEILLRSRDDAVADRFDSAEQILAGAGRIAEPVR